MQATWRLLNMMSKENYVKSIRIIYNVQYVKNNKLIELNKPIDPFLNEQSYFHALANEK